MIPLVIITAYRLIPARVRSLWSFGSSSSHLALQGIKEGQNGWRMIAQYGTKVPWDNPPMPPH